MSSPDIAAQKRTPFNRGEHVLILKFNGKLPPPTRRRAQVFQDKGEEDVQVGFLDSDKPRTRVFNRKDLARIKKHPDGSDALDWQGDYIPADEPPEEKIPVWQFNEGSKHYLQRSLPKALKEFELIIRNTRDSWRAPNLSLTAVGAGYYDSLSEVSSPDVNEVGQVNKL